MFKILDGKKLADELNLKTKHRIDILNQKKIVSTLAVILIGEDKASLLYVKNKEKACAYIGIKSIKYELNGNATQQQVVDLINKLNDDISINGVLVQLPLPKHINENIVLSCIKKEKDVDCFHPYNIGLLSIDKPTFKPCTPAGIIYMLKRYNINIESKLCVVVGASNIVGKPMAQMLLKEEATVVICHIKTKELEEICKKADIIITAVGKANIISQNMIKQGSILIDVGMNRDENNKLCGDADFDLVKNKCSYITPVPGGVGPMTVAKLMENCVLATELQRGEIYEFTK